MSTPVIQEVQKKQFALESNRRIIDEPMARAARLTVAELALRHVPDDPHRALTDALHALGLLPQDGTVGQVDGHQ